MSAPTWLRDHLIRTGAMTEKGVTRAAKARRCRRCSRVVIVGLTDANRCAIEATVDPTPLSRFGEMAALLARRYTVTARSEAGRYVLDDRNSWAIEGGPAGETARTDVLAEHRCGSPLPAACLADSLLSSSPIHPLPAGSPAPF